MDYDGIHCPNCRQSGIDEGEFEPNNPDSGFRNCSCEACGATWTEVFGIIDIDNLEVPTKGKLRIRFDDETVEECDSFDDAVHVIERRFAEENVRPTFIKEVDEDGKQVAVYDSEWRVTLERVMMKRVWKG